jgi:hypothetical protein
LTKHPKPLPICRRVKTHAESSFLDKPKRDGGAWSVLAWLVAITAALFVALLAGLTTWVVQPFAGQPQTTPPPVDARALERHVRMLSHTFHPRDHLHPINLASTAAYITREFEKTGARVVSQPYEIEGAAGAITVRNVIASFGPESADRIVIGAHYDSHESTPGADDNASGVAGLLELARLLARAPLTGQVDLVAYTLEEPPYFRTEEMGSTRHAAMLKQGGVAVKLMIALEMIGYFSDEEGSQEYPSALLKALYPTQGNFIGVIGQFGDARNVRAVKAAMAGATVLPVRSINAPAFIQGIDFSDHLNYWAEGYPALMVTNTAFFRNKAYHTPQDTADRLDYNRMAKVVQGVYAAVLAMPLVPVVQ